MIDLRAESIVVQFIKDLIAFFTLTGIAALGELVNEMAGVLVLCIEGALWIGALVAFIVAFFTENLMLAILAAIAASLLVYLLYGYVSLLHNVDQVYAGIAINLICYGASFYIYRSIFEWKYREVIPHVRVRLPDLEIPYLNEIPILGPAFFRQTLLTYILIFVAFPLAYVVIRKTHIGTVIRAIGEDPTKASTMGIPVNKYRLALLVIGGTLTGISSCMFTLYLSSVYLSRMVAGRGFIIIALIILGKWDTVRTLLACLLYSTLEVLQYRVQVLIGGVFPYQFVLMLPYLATITALGVFGRKIKPPASLGKTYVKLR